MDALHLAHLIVLFTWAGVVMAEFVVELAGRDTAPQVHFWIDVLLELPLLAGVLLTGGLLAMRHWPPDALLAVKMGAGLVAVAVNLYCVRAVVRRYLRRGDAGEVLRLTRHVLGSAVGVPFGLAAAIIGLAR